ncbi:MAG: caspase family protein [Pseudomonadales bacterium]
MWKFVGLLLGIGWPAVAAAAEIGPAGVDDLYIVDCLLPGQVRQLGTRMTYVSVRRGVKTSARDCAVRGGEYVRHDRADYHSALSVWLPAAQEGDNEARINVGTIFEQGLGAVPDYQQAAHWYRLAAEDGSVRAQLKLAALYEAGLGVLPDLQQALYWFRRATGSDDAVVSVVSAPGSSGQDLASDVARLSERISAMVAENEQLETALRRAEATLAEVQIQRTDERAQLESQISELRQGLTEREASIKALQTRFSAAGRALAASSENAREVRAQMEQRARAEAQAASRVAALERSLGDSSATIAELRADLAAREQALATQLQASDALALRIGELEARAAELSATRAVQAQAAAAAVLAAPSIVIIDPQLPTTRGQARGLVKVDVPASLPTQRLVGRVDAPAGLLSLTVNGAPAEVNASGVFLAELPIAAAITPVSIVAVDAQGQRAMVSLGFETAAEAAQAVMRADGDAPSWSGFDFGRYHALVIGNDEYLYLPKLETAVADATAIAGLLEARYGFQVTRLINADRYQILSALNHLRETLTAQDNLLIYYAGHGELDQVNMRGHWLPVDAEPDSSANWVSNVAVTDVLNAMSAKQILVLADSCYSGSLTRSALTELRSGMTAAEEQNWVRTMLQRRSRLAMTSGGLSPVLDAGGGAHSVFARALIEVLEGNRDLLEGRDLYEQVAARVAYQASNLRFEQVPEFAPIRHAGHEAGTFFLKPIRS